MKNNVVIAVVLIIIGTVLVINGYNKNQPNLADQAVSFVEEFTGKQAPESIKRDKSEGYFFMIGGSIVCLFGLFIVLKKGEK